MVMSNPTTNITSHRLVFHSPESSSEHPNSGDQFQNGASNEDNDYIITEEQKQASAALQKLNQDLLGDDDEDDEFEDDYGDAPDYDVRGRLKEINAQLDNEPEPDANRRRSVIFKEKLVDVAPPSLVFNDGDDDDELDSSDAGGTGGTREGRPSTIGAGDGISSEVQQKLSRLDLSNNNGNKQLSDDDANTGKTPDNNSQSGNEKDDEKVLVEINGKYELVSAKDLESLGYSGYIALAESPSTSTSQGRAQPNTQNTPARPGTAYSSRERSKSHTNRRVQSATHSRSTTSGSNYSEPHIYNLWEETNYKSPYGLTPQQRQLKQQREMAIRERERLEEEHRRKLEEQKKEDNESAFKHWLEKKRLEAYQQKKQQEDEDKEARKKDSQQAFDEWVKHKRDQQRQDKLLSRREQQEKDEGFFLRPREDCEKAFKEWLRKKNSAMKKAKEAELAKTRLHRMGKRSKKTRKMLRSAKEARSTRLVDYYGHTF